MLLNISNIQHFSVGDGDGIRTTVFFKGCLLRCPWCHNPETIPFGETILRYRNPERTERCGRKISVADIMREILEDLDYYQESGGGVTFSGGEVLMQADGAAVLAEQIKRAGISLFVDTAGCVAYDAFEKLNPYADTYLFDFKTASAEKYAHVIGGSLERVVSNISALLRDGKRVRIRIPLIPDFNIDPNSVDDICHVLTGLGIRSVDLLPFHRMGSGKYEAMGLDYRYKDTPPLEQSVLHEIRDQYAGFFSVNTEY